MTMDDVVSVQVFCTDLALYDTFNTVYRNYFMRGFPARAFLGASTSMLYSRAACQGAATWN